MTEEEKKEGAPTETNDTAKKPSSLKQIRTFQGDIAEALKDHKESIVSIQQQAEERRKAILKSGAVPNKGNETKDEGEGRDLKPLFLVLGSITLVALGVFGGWQAYTSYKVQTTPPIIITPEDRFLSVANTLEIDASDLTRNSLIGAIDYLTRENANATEITHISFRESIGEENKLVSIEKFLKILEARAPGSLVRAMEPTFMFGSIGENPRSHFAIFKLKSFENAFAGMLEWESNIQRDIGPIFPTWEYARNLDPNTPFRDVATRNKDARVLATAEGEVALLYSFFDNNILIVTDNLGTLRTLIDRLTREKLLR